MNNSLRHRSEIQKKEKFSVFGLLWITALLLPAVSAFALGMPAAYMRGDIMKTGFCTAAGIVRNGLEYVLFFVNQSLLIGCAWLCGRKKVKVSSLAAVFLMVTAADIIYAAGSLAASAAVETGFSVNLPFYIMLSLTEIGQGLLCSALSVFFGMILRNRKLYFSFMAVCICLALAGTVRELDFTVRFFKNLSGIPAKPNEIFSMVMEYLSVIVKNAAGFFIMAAVNVLYMKIKVHPDPYGTGKTPCDGTGGTVK